MYQILCGNLALNAIDNVVAHNSAAGHSTGSITVPSVDYTKLGNFGAVSLTGSRQGDIVPLVTIDSLALQENIFEGTLSADMLCVPRTGPLSIAVRNGIEITSPDSKRPNRYTPAPTR